MFFFTLSYNTSNGNICSNLINNKEVLKKKVNIYNYVFVKAF